MNTQNQTIIPADIDGKRVLAAGFRSVREAKKFAKFFALLTIFQYNSGDMEKDDFIEEMGQDYVEKELIKMNLPKGWRGIADYENAKQWFFQNCR